MTAESTLRQIPGGNALIDWFGRVPRFHDAVLLDIDVSNKRSSALKIHTWETTDQTDANGYLALDKHVVVTISLEEVTRVDLYEFDLTPGIIFELDIDKIDDTFRLDWSASYGVAGVLWAKQVRIDLAPGKPT